MYNTVFEFRKLGAVPAVCGAYKVSCDALESVDVVPVAMRTLLKSFRGVLVAAVKAAVSVMVHTAVADVILVHEVYDAHDGLRIVCGVTVNLDIENMSGIFVFVIWSFDFGLMLRSAMIVDRNVA